MTLQHAWSKAESRRGREPVEKIERLIVRLRNMLKVDDLKNGGSRTPQKLKLKLGKSYRDAFDFDLMAEVLEGSTPHNVLPPARRLRIRAALDVLESQRFFDVGGAGGQVRRDEHFEEILPHHVTHIVARGAIRADRRADRHTAMPRDL